MGSHLRRGRGGHRLPERPRREGGPGEGPPVPPVRRRQVRSRRCPPPCKKIAVLDRTKEPGALGEPLYLDVVTALWPSRPRGHQGHRRPLRPGLARTRRPRRVFAVYQRAGQGRAARASSPSASWTTSPTCPCPRTRLLPTPQPAGTIECKFWGLGGDGTVGANKNSIKIIGDHTDKYVQAYFQYDSKKTGGVTDQPPALRRHAHPQPLLHQQGRLRGLPQPRPTSRRTSRWSAT